MSKPLSLFPNYLNPNIDHVFTPICQDLIEKQIADLSRQVLVHVCQVQEALFISYSLYSRRGYTHDYELWNY
jgi:hypothetical protein